MRHVQSTGGGPCFFCQTLRRSCTDAASSRPWAVELRPGGGWFSGPPGGACSMGRGGRRSRGNPKGVPLARFGRGKFSTASAGQLSAKRYRKNLKAKTYRFRGGAIRRGAPRAARWAAASFSPSPAKGGCCLAPGWRKARAVWKVAACGQSRRVRARRREPGRASRFSRQRKSPTG